MSSNLQIRLLGEFSVLCNGESVTGFKSERLQAFFAYLVLHRDMPLPRQRVSFTFWEDLSDAQMLASLRKELYNLRRILPAVDQFLQVDAKTLQWHSNSGLMLDVVEFEQAIQTIEQATDSDQTLVALKRAAVLYQGDLLPNCEYDWMVPIRERLRQACMWSLEQLIQRLEKQQDYRLGIRYAQQLLRIDYLSEPAYYALMRLHYQSGDRATALQIYHQCMTVLREELGIDPSPATRELYEQLLTMGDESEAIALFTATQTSATPVQDWGESIDVSLFYGRETELSTLYDWLLNDAAEQKQTRLVTLLGMGGIGKTALAAKLAHELAEAQTNQKTERGFDFIIWRSLRNAPLLEPLLTDLVSFLSNRQETQADLGRLIYWLQQHRCLIILDNLETVFDEQWVGHFRPGYEQYGELLRVVAEGTHQSCMVLTSREKPAEISAYEGVAVRYLRLGGSPEAVEGLFREKGLMISVDQRQLLGERYGNSPLATKIVVTAIQGLFDGNIDAFLKEDTLVYTGIRRLLDEQFNRLSELECSIMYWLAINREWTTVDELQEDIIPVISRSRLLEALESLDARSLIEKQAGHYTQQAAVMEYVTDKLIEKVTTELITQDFLMLLTHALSKTTVKDAVRESQEQIILSAVAEQLYKAFGSTDALKRHSQNLLKNLRHLNFHASGYGAGNLLNLYRQLQLDLTGYDFSQLTIWHADLQQVNLQQVNFAHSELAKAIFAQRSDMVDVRPYAAMNITGVRGLTLEQINTLKKLGAIDEQEKESLQHSGKNVYTQPEIEPDLTAGKLIQAAASPLPLIGRDSEWKMIQAWMDKVSNAATSEVLLLAGEMGIGKTRLLEEFAHTVQQAGGCVLWGRGFEAEMVRPYGAWIDGLRAVAFHQDISLPKELGLLLPQGAAVDLPTDRSRLFDAVVQLLAQLGSAKSPIAIILDDIQWLDEASIALLHYAARLLQGSAVMFACAARQAELSTNEPVFKFVQTLRREQRLCSIALRPLGQVQTAALMHSIDQNLEQNHELAQRVFVESGGNPLFILEIVRSMAQEGMVHANNLEALIQDRLLQFDESTRELLPWASALGCSFNPTTLAQIADCSLPKLLTVVEQLEHQGIIRPGTVDSEIRYDFAHDIVRQVVYRQLSEPRQRLLHLQIAHSLQQTTQDDALASDIAHHAALGGDYSLATTASLTAAQRSLKLFAYAEAAELAQRGLQYCQYLDERSRIYYHAYLLRVYIFTGVTKDCVTQLEETLHQLITDASRLGLQEEEAVALEALIALNHDYGNITRVHEHSLRAAERGRTASPMTTARMLAYTGWCLAEIERDMPRAEALLLEAQALADRVGLELTDIQSGLGIVCYYAADWVGARSHLQQAWRMAHAAQDHWRKCICLKYLAMLELEAGNLSASLQSSHEMAVVAAQMGEGSEGAIATALTVLAQYRAHPMETQSALEQALLTLHQIDDQRMRAYTLAFAAETDLEQEQIQQAIDRSMTALEAAQIVEHQSCMALAWATIIQGKLALGELHQAAIEFGKLRQNVNERAISSRAYCRLQQLFDQFKSYSLDAS